MVQTTQITLRDRIQTIEDAIGAGKIEEAMSDCQRILARYPNALEIQRLLGEVYLAQSRLEEARLTFDAILVNDPENVIVYCDRALICEHHSDIDTALDCYQQAYELSRGNSQIRQEFNNLSKQSDQQEFMLSRAGLARLYMRGHLYTQAIQEWEAVLAASPERLDARLGLLETCWRDGLFEQADNIAIRVLDEVPQCLKALLILAHITSANNMQRAHDLIDRALMLDPEMLMAQDLFSELSVSQPNDPFLALIHTTPIKLQDGKMKGNGKSIDAINTLQYAAIDIEAESRDDQPAAEEHTFDWNEIDSWSELDTRLIPQPSKSSAIEYTASLVDTMIAQPSPPQEEQSDDFDRWVDQQEIDDDFDATLLEKQPWFQAEQTKLAEDIMASSTPNSSEPEADGIAPVHMPADPIASATDFTEMPTMEDQKQALWQTLAAQDYPWATFTPKAEAAEPPAWLDMLTNFEQRQPPEATSPHPALKTNISPEPDSPPFFLTPDDKDEEDMGWPRWLKSLGAESMEPESTPPQASHPSQIPGWADMSQTQPSPLTDADATDSWASQLEALTAVPETETPFIPTLETLEQNLYSQGFVPLQPGSLSAIAQEPTLPAPITTPTPAESEEEQPSWQETLEASMISGAQPEATTTIAEVSARVTSPLTEATPVEDTLESTPAAKTPADDSGQPAQRPTESIPVYSLDTLLDSELETTMRRPAVRLQPMSQPELALTPKAHSIDYRARSSDSALSNKERLVRGYQFQLAGAYDDAMQEYRTLIRNSPESLGEVISNVRALLKLAPKYTAGYRVLGDAYMRQGEYLQAMEAYNKALSIAKKAKIQSR